MKVDVTYRSESISEATNAVKDVDKPLGSETICHEVFTSIQKRSTCGILDNVLIEINVPP